MRTNRLGTVSVLSVKARRARAPKMGQASSAPFRDVWYGPEQRPDWTKGPTFDPMAGFPNGRKIRDPKVTPEELDAYKVPLNRRDYCAHLFIRWIDCKRVTSWPFIPCDIVFQDFEACEHEDFVLRMKEFERERRLMIRENRIKRKLAHESM